MTFQITTQGDLTYVFFDGTEVCVVGGVFSGIVKCCVKKYKVKLKIKIKDWRFPPYVHAGHRFRPNDVSLPLHRPPSFVFWGMLK